MGDRQTAVVTGASRGIGKATAIALARSGFDVAITARTVTRLDETRVEGIDAPLPGSLEETAEEIHQVGGEAHSIRLDLLNRHQLVPAAEEALERLGHVDVLVNNAIWVGPGNNHRIHEIDYDEFDKRMFGNATAQVQFMTPILTSMATRGSGLVLNMSSAAAYAPPFALPGKGGWGLAYSMAKGAFHRIAPQISFEYRDRGIVALNVQPGFVATERLKMAGSGSSARVAELGIDPAIVGGAVAHVAGHPEQFDPTKTVQLPALALKLGLIDQLPSWDFGR